MTGHPSAAEAPTRSQPDYPAIGAVALLAYFVMAGDLALRDTHPAALIIDAILVAGVVLFLVLRAPGRADWLDGMLVLALLIFSVSGVFSQFPRQSLDSVLGALAYVAALFAAREVLGRDSARRIFIFGLMALSVVLTAIASLYWLGTYLRWWSLTDWSVIPPLGMNVQSSPWGHRHDLALLLAMLYPAWWVGRMTRPRAIAAIVVGMLTVACVLIGGSRMVWLAAIGATMAIGAPLVSRRIQWTRARSLVVAACIVMALIALLVLGVAEPIGERLLGGASLAERTAMWGPLVSAWADRPIAGFGPGSFPWILQPTGYFNTHTFSPKHPDSAVIQVLAEGGLLGIAAMGLVVFAVIRTLWGNRSLAANWALVAFGLAAIAGNPTDFHFMVAVAAGWLAFAAPHRPPREGTAAQASMRPIRVASVLACVVIGAAFGAATIAHISFTAARTSVLLGNTAEAGPALELAIALDPGMALYPRQLGALRLLESNPEGAVSALTRAAALNPNDDLIWRELAIAHDEVGDSEGSRAAVATALRVQLSDPTNLLLAARAARESGDPSLGQLLVRIVQAWPEILAAPGWSKLASADKAPQLVAAASRRWTEGEPSPEPLVAQQLLLSALLDSSGVGETPPSQYSEAFAAGYQQVTRCDAEAESMTDTSESDRREAMYWLMTVRWTSYLEEDPEPGRSLFALMTGDILLADGWDDLLNPLNENGQRGSSADRWGYRRQPIFWPSTPWDLPSPRSGIQHWVLDPEGAAREAGLAELVPECR